MKIELPPLHPRTFFEIKADIRYFNPKKHKKLTSSFLIEDAFEEMPGQFFFGWNEKALALRFCLPFTVEKCFYPDFRRGSSVEFLLCTRAFKSSYLGKYHHHFVFFPEKTGGHWAREVTRMRSEDRHDLALPQDLFVESEIGPKSYALDIFISRKALCGYDPQNFRQMSFTYIVNRYRESSFCYSAPLEEYAVEKKPALWSSCFLLKD